MKFGTIQVRIVGWRTYFNQCRCQHWPPIYLSCCYSISISHKLRPDVLNLISIFCLNWCLLIGTDWMTIINANSWYLEKYLEFLFGSFNTTKICQLWIFYEWNIPCGDVRMRVQCSSSVAVEHNGWILILRHRTEYFMFKSGLQKRSP